MKDEHDIAVVPYILYDALMERFERTQKNLRLSVIVSIVMVICFFASTFVGAIHGNSKDSLHG